MPKTKRFLLIALAILASSVIVQADIHHGEVWLDLDHCTRGGWVEYHIPQGTYLGTWRWSDGYTSSVSFQCTSSTGCYIGQTVNNGYVGWPTLDRHTVDFSYIGDEPPNDTPFYYGGDCF